MPEQFNNQLSMTGPQGQLTNQAGYFNTQLPQNTTNTSPLQNQTFLPSFPNTGLSTGEVAGGLALGGLLGGNFNLNDIISGAANYYGGQEGIKAAYGVGQAGLGLAEQMGQRASEATQFKPFTVTTNLGRAGTTPEGGFTLELSPEQQALQTQLLGQAGNLFKQVGQDPATQQQAIYEQIRQAQMPEEERERLRMQEGLFASGRGGIQTAQYGGSPEQFAYEKARAEAQSGALLQARNQALAEQAQSLESATGLLGSGFTPQREALQALGYGTDLSNIASTAAARGAGTQATLGQAGLESYLQGTQLATNLQQQQNAKLTSFCIGYQYWRRWHAKRR